MAAIDKRLLAALAIMPSLAQLSGILSWKSSLLVCVWFCNKCPNLTRGAAFLPHSIVNVLSSTTEPCPNDNVDQIMRKLTKAVGVDGFYYTIPIGPYEDFDFD